MDAATIAKLEGHLKRTFGNPHIVLKARPKQKDSAEVEVKGTRFTVSVDSGSTDVTVEHGRVDVRNRQGVLQKTLVPGEHTRIARRVVALDPPPPAPPAERQTYSGDSAFHLYVREIGQTKLLTPKEDIQLARRIQKGDAKAREHMIKANLRLVVKIARDYENYGLPLLDLINEGNIGLMKAV